MKLTAKQQAASVAIKSFMVAGSYLLLVQQQPTSAYPIMVAGSGARLPVFGPLAGAPYGYRGPRLAPAGAGPLQLAASHQFYRPLQLAVAPPSEAEIVDKIERHLEHSLMGGGLSEERALRPVAAGSEYHKQAEAGEEEEAAPAEKKHDQHHEHHHEHHEHQPVQHAEHPPEAFEVHHKKGGKSFQYFHQGHHEHHRRRR